MLVAMQLVRERPLIGVAGRAGTVGIDADDVEMAGVVVTRVACERLDAREPCEPLVVERELPRANLAVVVELLELDERDRGEDVREARLEAG